MKTRTSFIKGHLMPNEVREKIRKSCIGRKHTEEAKRKISNYRKGKVMTDEQKEKLRQATIRQIKEGRMPTKDTNIEKLIENQLLFNDILYVKQYPYKLGIADFWLPETNIIIECDGTYWHSKPVMKKRDLKQNLWLEDNDFLVFRFSDKQILSSPAECIEKCGVL